MILAAGRGARMRPLTDDLPKPLLPAGGKPLIVWQIEALVAAGICELVINHAWQGAKLEAAIGDGARWGAQIRWSPEREALETAGGIANALPLLCEGQSNHAPFAVLNGDVWCDWDRARLAMIGRQITDRDLDAWCVLVPNPTHHPQGDFRLEGERLVVDAPGAQVGAEAGARHTFSGFGVYSPQLFEGLEPGTKAPLAPLLRRAIQVGRAGGECHRGIWFDVGTPERLASLDAMLSCQPEHG
jgi:MurNAc alpha-1-phosphate uridylyltransferase